MRSGCIIRSWVVDVFEKEPWLLATGDALERHRQFADREERGRPVSERTPTVRSSLSISARRQVDMASRGAPIVLNVVVSSFNGAPPSSLAAEPFTLVNPMPDCQHFLPVSGAIQGCEAALK
jgi:hypothetical protein